MKLLKLVANLGYGSRKEVTAMVRDGRITDPQGEVLYTDDEVDHSLVRVDGDGEVGADGGARTAVLLARSAESPWKSVAR